MPEGDYGGAQGSAPEALEIRVYANMIEVLSIEQKMSGTARGPS